MKLDLERCRNVYLRMHSCLVEGRHLETAFIKREVLKSTPLSGDSRVIAFAHEALFRVRNETGFCYVALKLFQDVTSSSCIYRVQYPHFLSMGNQSTKLLFSRKFMAKQRKKNPHFLGSLRWPLSLPEGLARAQGTASTGTVAAVLHYGSRTHYMTTAIH